MNIVKNNLDYNPEQKLEELGIQLSTPSSPVANYVNTIRSGNLVYFYNNFLTPCELEGFFNCPTWSLRIDETRYDIEKDKFNHYDTFLQIADYKVFYIP